MKIYNLLPQKIIGVVCILLGVLISAIERDLTAAIFATTPLGIWLLVTKEQIITLECDDE